MSMNIVLEMNNSPEIQMTKSITTVATITGTLKDGSDVVSPVVLFQSEGAPLAFNYATISDFNRSYFLRGMRNITANMWEMSLEVDAISSFATGIKACSGIIGKSASSYNLYLNDNEYKCEQDPYIVPRIFPFGFNDTTQWSYVLALCAGKEPVT